MGMMGGAAGSGRGLFSCRPHPLLERVRSVEQAGVCLLRAAHLAASNLKTARLTGLPEGICLRLEWTVPMRFAWASVGAGLLVNHCIALRVDGIVHAITHMITSLTSTAARTGSTRC